MTFYLKGSVLEVTFSFNLCSKNNLKKTLPVIIYICSHSQNGLEVLDSGLSEEDIDLESMAQGNPSKEEADATRSNLGITMPTEKHFQRET